MSIADLDAIDRANERAVDMWAFLAAHPEYKYQRVTFPTKHLCDGGDYVTADKTDVRATLARFTPEKSKP